MNIRAATIEEIAPTEFRQRYRDARLHLYGPTKRQIILVPPPIVPEPEPDADETPPIEPTIGHGYMLVADVNGGHLATPTAKVIIGYWSAYARMPRAVLFGRSRLYDIALRRQTVMWLLRTLGGLSYPRIGHICGGRDHTTVIHAYQKIERLRAERPPFAAEIDQVAADIQRLVEAAAGRHRVQP